MSEWPRFADPWVLVLLLAVPWTVWIGSRIASLSPVRKWTAVTLRTIILLCLIFALAGAEWVRRNDELAVFFLLDHSDSVPEDERLRSAQWVRNAAKRYMTDRDKAGVIVFGEDASIELSADESLGLGDIMSYVEGSQTDLAAAMRLAMAAFPQGHMKRLVVYTDGNETRGAALDEAKRAQAAGVEVSVVPLVAEAPNEVRVRSVSVPNNVEADEPFQVRVVAHSDTDTEATLRLFQRAGSERRMLPPQRVRLQPGDNTFVLTQEVRASGFYEYEVRIEAEDDAISENNAGQAYAIVHGEPRVLYVASDPPAWQSHIEALRAEGIAVELATPGELGTSLAQLQNFDTIVLSDVSGTELTADQMTTLQAAVRDLGIGLIMVGGPQSFGAGGYLDTPIEEALPVDMDIKQRKILPRGALALVLHTMEFPDGNAWANEISLAALNVLSAQDLMGLLAYHWQGGDGWIEELKPVGDKSAMRRAIRQGTANIGDMPAVGPTLQLAYDSLVGADAAAKRVLIISDGDPAAPSNALLGKLSSAGIPVSTICINPHSPSDQNMLRYVAERTGGQFYFVNNPQNLPQIFTKEASVVKRGLLIEEEFTPQVNHDSELLQGLATGLPGLRGYVVTTAKESATVPLVSHESDPVLAHWRYGLGKAVAFTSDATSRWAEPWLGWGGFNRFWAQTVRWATREITPSDFRVETYIADGRGHIRVDAVDDEGRFINFLRPRGVVTSPGPDYERREIDLPQTAPGIYEADFPLDEAGVYMINLQYARPEGGRGTLQAGLSLGYSPEYEYTTTNQPLLEELAAIGDGRVMAPDDNPFEHTLESAPRVTALWPWLVTTAIVLFPIEIFIRRVVVPFGAISAALLRLMRRVKLARRFLPAPAPRPVPATGTYFSAAEGRDFTQVVPEAAPEIAATGRAVGAQSPESTLGEAEEGAPASKEPSAYTQELLAAKQRAIEKRTRRVDSRDD